MLRDKVKRYFEISESPKLTFCRRVGISPSHFYQWLKGEREISDEKADRIQEYLDKYSTMCNKF